MHIKFYLEKYHLLLLKLQNHILDLLEGKCLVPNITFLCFDVRKFKILKIFNDSMSYRIFYV